MAVTAPTDVTAWIPEIISSNVYDTAFESDYALSAFAQAYPDLEGQPGEKFVIPTLNPVTPADNLAVTTPAVDDKLSGAGVEVTIKEAVKSVAFYDRVRYATGTDFDALAGRKGGDAVRERIELDLGAAAYAGRNTAADSTVATLSLATLGAMKAKIPSKLRRRGLTLFGSADVLDTLLADTTIMNAAAFGSDEAIRNGAFSRPILGITPVAVDDDAFPDATGGQPQVALMVNGVLVRVLQKAIGARPERDERARLTRIVTTALHAEGVVDSRGVVFTAVGA